MLRREVSTAQQSWLDGQFVEDRNRELAAMGMAKGYKAILDLDYQELQELLNE